MRSFIGLDLSPSDKLALAEWREKALPSVSAKRPEGLLPNQKSPPVAVPPENYHITLAFLGDITHRQHDELLSVLDELTAEPFDVELDITGHWEGPKILFAAPSAPEKPLMKLAKEIRKAARACGISVESREYRPHVTLVRKATSDVPPPLLPPSVKFHCQDFHFFESVSTPSGVRYPIRHSWSLEPDISVRERLRRGLL